MNQDVFEGKISIGKGSPPKDFQPPMIGYLWIDYSKPTIYACINNTIGNIQWCHLDEDEFIKLNKRVDELNTKLNQYLKKLDDYMNGRWP